MIASAGRTFRSHFDLDFDLVADFEVWHQGVLPLSSVLVRIQECRKLSVRLVIGLVRLIQVHNILVCGWSKSGLPSGAHELCAAGTDLSRAIQRSLVFRTDEILFVDSLAVFDDRREEVRPDVLADLEREGEEVEGSRHVELI